MTLSVPPTTTSSSSAYGSVVFFGRANAAQTLGAANAPAAVLLQTHSIDDLNGHSLATNTSRYVVQRAGLYSIVGGVLWTGGQAAATGNQTRIAAIWKNGVAIPGSGTYFGYYGLPHTQATMPVFATCAVNDYLELYCASGLASTQTAGDSGSGSILRVEFVR